MKTESMAVTKWFVVVAFEISFMASACYAAKKARPFSGLQASLEVTASAQSGQVLAAGVDKITVTWWLNSSFKAGAQDSAYKTVEAKLCYAPVSQLDRPWRKNVLNNIAKDKTCRFSMFSKPYAASNTTETYTVQKDVPSATYFIRVYASDSGDKEVAYGQTTNGAKTSNLFTVVGINGRTTSIDVASGIFSALSLLSLAYFFYVEKKLEGRPSRVQNKLDQT